MKIAVILFAYKRPKYLKKCLASLGKAYSLRMAFNYYAIVDYSLMQDKIAKLIRNSGLFDKIIKRDFHHGVDKNIKNGIFQVLRDGHDAVIVLEDDLIIDPKSLQYLYDQLIKYEHDKSIGQITLQGNYIHSHGWATWKDRWMKIDFDRIPLEGHLVKQYLKNGATWDVIFHNNCDLLGWKAVGKKLAKHIGTIGTHYNILDLFSIRKYYRKWNENYYRDKDIMMVGNEPFIVNIFRAFNRIKR
jgi:hypothetical protein